MFDASHLAPVASPARDGVLPAAVADAIAPLTWVAGSIYVLAVAALALYGLHSLWLLALFLRHRRAAAAQAAREAATPLPADADLPHVLVQLPVFNERDVVVRVLDAIGRLDWPRDRLHIQLLDDSTDDSVHIGREAVARLRTQGLDAVSLHRTDRTGYKAGALEAGMRACDAPFIAIFDADFIPRPDFLRIAVKPLLADPGLALVQGRWEHTNRDESILTRAQAVGIDGHFAVEQGARAWSGLPMNFNGTCGLWRRTAIVDAGGWEHDTLTEDMDLSYRAQLVGWRCTYRIGLGVPGEVPADINAWRSQQFRWAKGSIQTAIKLLPRVWRSTWGLHSKLCSTLHMTHYLVHPLILLSLFTAPLAMLLVDHGSIPIWVLALGIGSFAVGACAPIAVYIVSQLVLHGRGGWRNLRVLPVLAAIGTGIAISNTTAAWQALRGQQSAFVRTPKAGSGGTSSYRARAHSGMPEAMCAMWAVVGMLVGFIGSHTWITPLLAIYLSGFAWMSFHCVRQRQRQRRAHQQAEPRPVPAADDALAQPA
jgi:cellulose synthase/poly-beta-1,6-N-acetylglucosamine synthase-like glycosyltransferase